VKRTALALSLVTLLAGEGLAQISPKQDAAFINAKIQTIYSSTVGPAQNVFKRSLSKIVVLLYDFKKSGDFEKLAPHVMRDPVLEAIEPEFYQAQPMPLTDIIDEYMPAHYLAVAKMNKVLDETSLDMTEREYADAQRVIDLITPEKYIIRLPDHGIWYNTTLTSVAAAKAGVSSRQIVWSTCKDKNGREVEIRVVRDIVDVMRSSADNVKYNVPVYNAVDGIIQARFKGDTKWVLITTDTQQDLDEFNRYDAQQAKNPLQAEIRAKYGRNP
jgi:hypothetical protein